MVEALMHTVGDGAVVEKRGEHLVHGVQHVVLAAHVEERFLLAGEGGVGEVLGGGTGAHGHGNSVATHGPPRSYHLLLEAGRKGGGEDALADAGTDLGEFDDVVDVQAGQLGINPVR